MLWREWEWIWEWEYVIGLERSVGEGVGVGVCYRVGEECWGGSGSGSML